MWHDVAIAFALFLIIEGVFPFLSPAALRTIMLNLSQLSDQQLRFAGFSSMLLGVVLLYLVN